VVVEKCSHTHTKNHTDGNEPEKHMTVGQCCFEVGSADVTLVQYCFEAHTAEG
jgi:hypothetical protein